MTHVSVLSPMTTSLAISHHPCFACGRSFVYRFHPYDSTVHLTLVDFICNACLPAFVQRVEKGLVDRPDILSPQRAARWIGISRARLMRQLERGVIPYRRQGRRVLIYSADVLAYIHAQGCQS